ncbi:MULTISPECIES: hypothetical protein [unclassified Streptomyces]|uniref:hypothetical protein n=1 Tax=unclassified Streptomyces TaxID=2593676 RepID=UPI00037E24A6|nr:hypothetical protein [Streptomyces sp. Amel2xE9]
MSRQAEADEKGGNTSRGAGAGPVRVLAGAAGVALMGTGVSLLLDVRDLTGVLVWLGAALAVHDVLIAPLVLLAGLAVTRVGARGARGGVRGTCGGVRGARGGVRGPVRGALLVAGALTAVALPPLLRPGAPANSSVLPLDYLRNWLLALAAVAAVTTALIAVRHFARRHFVRRRFAQRPFVQRRFARRRFAQRPWWWRTRAEAAGGPPQRAADDGSEGGRR